MAEQSGESEEREGIGEDRRPSLSDWLVARQDGSLYTRMVTHPGTNRVSMWSNLVNVTTALE